MKIEICENTAIVSTVCVVALAVAVMSLGGCYICEQTNQKAIATGLVQKPTQSQSTHWEKP